jgi:hypothetical protein
MLGVKLRCTVKLPTRNSRPVSLVEGLAQRPVSANTGNKGPGKLKARKNRQGWVVAPFWKGWKEDAIVFVVYVHLRY